MADIANSDAATVRHGGSIARRPSAAATGLVVDLHLGQRVLGPPTSENVTEYCIWVGKTDVPANAESNQMCCLVRLLALSGDTATVHTLKSSRGDHGHHQGICGVTTFLT